MQLSVTPAPWQGGGTTLAGGSGGKIYSVRQMAADLNNLLRAPSRSFYAAASFAFLRQARSANLRASRAPRSRQSELMSQSSLGQ